LPVSLVRDPQDNYLCRGYPPIRVAQGPQPELTLRRAAHELLAVLEPELRRNPDQWHVMNPIFGAPMTAEDIQDPPPFQPPIEASA
nr:hypothetical protein [Candidatus Dormibacteraeota bacterium]